MIRRLVQSAVVLSIVVLLSAGMTVISFAAGWEKESDAWMYGKEDGSYVTDAWKKLGGRYYYFDGNGEMAANTLIEDDGETYYVNADGARVINQWMAMPNTGGEWGEDVNAVWFYFGSTGKAYRGEKKTIDGKIYLFDDEAHMLSGWQTYGDDSDLYYLGTEEEGWAYTGWQQLEPGENYLDTYEGLEWFYFRPDSGKAYRDVRKKINGAYYKFDEYGAMEEKWVTGTPGDSNQQSIASGSNALYQEGAGSQQTGWAYAYAPDDRGEDGDKAWYYLDSKGVPFNEHAKNTYQTDHPSYNLAMRIKDQEWLTGVAAKVINGKSYLFDENGKMLTGFYFLSGVKRTGSSVPLGKEGGFYYFNKSDGPQLGQMMTGKQTIEYDGVENHHYFRKNGMAYTNLIVDGYLYNPNGNLLVARDGNDYEIIHVPQGLNVGEFGNSNIHTDCRFIVNSSGKLKKSGTVKIDNIRYTIKNYEIIKEEVYEQ